MYKIKNAKLYTEQYQRIYGSSKTKDEIIKDMEKENSELKQKLSQFESDLSYKYQEISQLYSQISQYKGGDQ